MSDPLVIALTRLCGGTGRDAKPRRVEVAETLGVNEQTLYQIVKGIRLESGRSRTVGRELREKLDRHYPGWLTEADEAAATQAAELDPAEELLKALTAIRNQLVHSHDEASVRAGEALRLLAMTPDSERAFNNALAALIQTRREELPRESGVASTLDHALSPPANQTSPVSSHVLGGGNQPDGGEEWKHRGKRIGQSIKPISATTARGRKPDKEKAK